MFTVKNDKDKSCVALNTSHIPYWLGLGNSGTEKVMMWLLLS